MSRSYNPETGLKTCSKCREKKPLPDFYKDRSRPDGYEHICKMCKKSYDQTPARREARRQQVNPAKRREYNISNREANKAHWKAWHHRNKKKARAKWLVRYHVKVGHIPHWDILPCTDCGEKSNLYHHPDYSRPLDVVPLCYKCHGIRHRLTPREVSP